jgi:hypothetical protein
MKTRKKTKVVAVVAAVCLVFSQVVPMGLAQGPEVAVPVNQDLQPGVAVNQNEVEAVNPDLGDPTANWMQGPAAVQAAEPVAAIAPVEPTLTTIDSTTKAEIAKAQALAADFAALLDRQEDLTGEVNRQMRRIASDLAVISGTAGTGRTLIGLARRYIVEPGGMITAAVRDLLTRDIAEATQIIETTLLRIEKIGVAITKCGLQLRHQIEHVNQRVAVYFQKGTAWVIKTLKTNLAKVTAPLARGLNTVLNVIRGTVTRVVNAFVGTVAFMRDVLGRVADDFLSGIRVLLEHPLGVIPAIGIGVIGGGSPILGVISGVVPGIAVVGRIFGF